MIRGNSSLQEKFGDIEVIWGPRRTEHAPNGDSAVNGVQRINVIEALLKLSLETAPSHFLDARLAACECIKAFFANHGGIRMHVLGRAITGHFSGQDQIPNILTILHTPPEIRGNADPYQTWMASVLMFHLLFENSEVKAAAMKVTEGDAENGEEVITCVQAITGSLITGIQRGDDERISIGYLMLLCGWLFEDPDGVNDFLGEGSSIQTLLQETRHRPASNVLVPGLCTILLGIIYEFSSKDSPISRQTIHKLLLEQLGRDLYIDKITRFRECPLVRDFEVLPQTAIGPIDGGLPDIYFDRTFVEFLKDNFSRLIRAIDREPGLEISVITNGVERGVSRELVDTLRAELEDRKQALQNLESDMITLRQHLEQEQFSHRQIRESSSSEVAKIQQMNEALQKDHQAQLSKLEEEHQHAKNELLRQHGEQLRAIDNQLKDTSADYDRRSQRAREHYEGEIAELKKTIHLLESELGRVREQYVGENAGLKQKVQSLESEFNGAKEQHASENAELKKTIQSLESDTNEAKERLASENAELTKKIQSLESDTNEAKDRLGSENEELKKTIQSLESDKNEAKERLASENEDLKKTIQSLESGTNQAKERLESENAQLKKAIESLELNATKVKEQHAGEVAGLNETIQNLHSQIDSTKEQHATEVTSLKDVSQTLQSELDKLKEKSARDIQAVHDDYKSKCATLEKRAEEAESKAGKAGTDGNKATEALEAAQREAEKAKSEAKEKEEARKAAQSELEDLLIVFGDLEAKRNEDKVCVIDYPCWIPS